MHVCVCIYIYMYVCICVYVYVFMYVCANKCTLPVVCLQVHGLFKSKFSTESDVLLPLPISSNLSSL
jgi:hypothetical protein